MKGTTQILLVWACTLGLAFYIGRQNGRKSGQAAQSPVKEEQTQMHADPAKRTQVQVKSNTTNYAYVPSQSQKVNDQFYSRDSRGAHINLLQQMKTGDPVMRANAFSTALQNLTEENLPEVLEAFDTLPKGFTRYNELRMLLHAWAKMDPEAAIEYASNLSRQERRFGKMTALSSWASADSEAALAWAENDAGERDNNPYMPAIVAGTAEQDLGKATDLLFDMSYGSNRGQALRMLISHNIQQGGTDRLVRWADSIPTDRDPKLVEGISSMVASQMADYDLEAAADWVKNLGEERGRERAISSMVREMADESHDSAKEWLSSLPEKDQYSAMPDFIRRWAHDDATAAGEYLNQFPASEELDPAISSYVRSIRREDPEAAKEWANSIVNEETRNQAIAGIENPESRQERTFRFDGRGGEGGRVRVRVE